MFKIIVSKPKVSPVLCNNWGNTAHYQVWNLCAVIGGITN